MPSSENHSLWMVGTTLAGSPSKPPTPASFELRRGLTADRAARLATKYMGDPNRGAMSFEARRTKRA